MRSFLLALGFLTRLAKASIATDKEMQQACRFFPLVGFCLGAICLAPFWFGLLTRYPVLQAWLFLSLHIYLTRGFHQDGLADLSDALGSGATDDTFRSILKDSRLGAFGAIGLLLLLSGQLICFSYLFQQKAFGVLLVAPALSRSLALSYAVSAPMYSKAALGSISGNSPKQISLCIGIVSFLFLGFIFLSFPIFFSIFLGNCFLYLFFYWLAHRTNGFNGDYLGSLVCVSELITPLIYLATSTPF